MVSVIKSPPTSWFNIQPNYFPLFIDTSKRHKKNFSDFINYISKVSFSSFDSFVSFDAESHFIKVSYFDDSWATFSQKVSEWLSHYLNSLFSIVCIQYYEKIDDMASGSPEPCLYFNWTLSKDRYKYSSTDSPT